MPATPDYYKTLGVPRTATTDEIKKAEAEQDYTSRLALQEEAKTLPFTAVWDMYCLRQGAPVGDEWLKQVKQYEKDVQFKRG